MGNENARHEAKNSKGRGSTNNQKRLDAFTQRAGRAGSADWGDAMPEHLAAVVIAATKVGGAVTFGLSRDGGAFMLTLLLDGERATLWFNGDADLAEELGTVYAKLEALD